MNRQVIENKLESLRRCLQRVEERCPDSVDALIKDIDAQDVLTLNLSRAVQLCVDIALHILSARNHTLPQTMAGAFTALAEEGVIDTGLAEKMRKAVGFRNIAIYKYEAIDWAIVYAFAMENLENFKWFVKRFVIDRDGVTA